MPRFSPDLHPGVEVHESAYVDEPCTIGEGTCVWHFSHIMAGCEIGRACRIGQNVFIARGVRMGNNVKVQNNVSIYEGVVLEDDVFCGPSMVFTNIATPRSEIVRRGEYIETLVGRGATLGANSTIVCGTTIGRLALVGAGAVVTRDAPPYALMLGVPARRVGWVCRCGHTLEAARGQTVLACPSCRNQYEEAGEGLRILREMDEGG